MAVSQKVPIWLPYLDKIERVKKGEYIFHYKGGEEKADINSIHSIMIYGDYGSLDASILEEIAGSGCPIVIHKRNVARAVYVTAGLRPDIGDTLTKQIMARQNDKKCRHIARMIVRAKIKSCAWLVAPYEADMLSPSMTIHEIRTLEANHARRYWQKFYTDLGYDPGRRNKESLLSQCLDAQSKFLTGVILRWVTYHHMSPSHGYLHVATDYPALVYDAMEPYRGLFDKVIYNYFLNNRDIINDEPETKKITLGAIIDETKLFMRGEVYVHLTRQIIHRQELLHGVILSLKAYLNNDQKTLAIPLPGWPMGGRMSKVGWRFYGRYGGKTDFREKAMLVAQEHEKIMMLHKENRDYVKKLNNSIPPSNPLL